MRSLVAKSLFAACVVGLFASSRARAADPTPGVDPAALAALVERARKSDSDALIVIKDGVTIGTWDFDKPVGPIESMSATKSVVSLAFGRLLADGRLASLDEPVHRWYPEWNQGRKSAITIRHLLAQRSGLQCEPITTEIYRAPDFVQLALAAELTDAPGTQFRYNNKGVNLLAGVVQKIAGKRMDVLIGEEIFAPLGITDWNWSLDAAGNPHGMSGLQILPADLAKIGQLMLDRGTWNGTRILPEAFVEDAVHDRYAPRADAEVKSVAELWGDRYGLLWWVTETPQWAITDRLLDEWRRLGASEEFVTKMATLKDVRGEDLPLRASELAGGEEQWAAATWQANRPDFDIVSRSSDGFSAEGYLGQYLVVVPRDRIIAVRMRRAPEGEFDARRIDTFKDFKSLVLKLVQKADDG